MLNLTSDQYRKRKAKIKLFIGLWRRIGQMVFKLLLKGETKDSPYSNSINEDDNLVYGIDTLTQRVDEFVWKNLICIFLNPKSQMLTLKVHRNSHFKKVFS